MRIHIKQSHTAYKIAVKRPTGSWADRHGKMTVAEAKKLNADYKLQGHQG